MGTMEQRDWITSEKMEQKGMHRENGDRMEQADLLREDKTGRILAAAGIENRSRAYGDRAFGYFVFALAVLAFGAIYEHFSFGVYSPYMIYAFVYPLVLGVLPYTLLARAGRMPESRAAGMTLWGFGIVTLTVGSIVTGVIDIYGTTNALTRFYPAVGILLLVAGAALVPKTELKEDVLREERND